MHYRTATYADTPRVMEIIRQAQAQIRALGSDQWQNGYPALQDIERDIEYGQGIGSFRVDTNFDNHYMQRMLSTLGFTLCGEISYEGAMRRAYEKLLR